MLTKNLPRTPKSQGSVLRLILLTQLYSSVKPDETTQLVRLQEYIKDEDLDDTAFSDSKFRQIEVAVFGSECFRKKNCLAIVIVTRDGISLASSSTVRTLRVIFDQDLGFDSHIKQVSKTSFFHLHNIVKIRNILSQSNAEKLVHAFVVSTPDYCNSLSLESPEKSLKSL